MKRHEAEAFIAALVVMRSTATDAQASRAVSLYPTLRADGALVPAGMRINWHGTIKRAAADLWDTEENSPDNAPALWEDIAYREGYRIIPDVITAGTAFMKGECGWRGGVLYESLIDANVYTPEAYPQGWAAKE